MTKDDLLEQLQARKERISAFLVEFFDHKRDHWQDLNRWGPDVIDRLEKYTLKGKMLRGALILWMVSFYGKDESEALEAAAAVELIQSALLIHDDIMDQDVVRRGVKSLHKQYEALAFDESLVDPAHFGISQAICIGDISLFFAYDLLSRAHVQYSAQLSGLFSELVAIVGLGQMQDVYFGHAKKMPSQEDILRMYEHKTATYTFSLPLMLGAIIGGVDDDGLPLFDELGKFMGKIFQLKDDELGLFGEDLGKSLGIDIVSGKKTVFYSLLFESMSFEEKECFASLQGLDALDDRSLSFVRSMLMKYSLQDIVSEKMAVLAGEARVAIAALPLPDDGKSFLLQLLDFNLRRVK